MTTPLARYLSAGRAAPNAAPALPDLPPPVFRWTESGQFAWDRTIDALAEDAGSLPAAELAQGLGRLLGVCAALVGGHPAFDRVAALLEHGDERSVSFAKGHEIGELRLEAEGAWADEVDRLHRPPGVGDPTPDAPLRRPGYSLVQGASSAVAAAARKWQAHGSTPAWRAWLDTRNALERLISVLMHARHELSADEALVWAHQLLDPAARQPAPGGLWVATGRRGRSVRAAYGRGAARLLTAEYETVVGEGPLGAPAHAHRLLGFGPARRGGPPSDADATAALADLVRRGVRVAAPGDGWSRARLAAVGFAAVGPAGVLAVDADAARALVYAHPRPR